MAEQDGLRGFSFPKNKGLFVQFEDGDEFKLRVLTTDPMVSEKEFVAKDGTVNLSTKFAFVVWNYTLEMAQILNAGATITKEIQRIHQDEDFGANIKKVDIKITATGKDLGRKYTVNVLPNTKTLTMDQIKECQAINLEEKIENGQRMSFYKPKDRVDQTPDKEIDVTDDDLRSVEDQNFLDSIPF